MSDIPNDQDITKQQLWQRMDELHSSAELQIQAVLDKFDDERVKLESFISEKIFDKLKEIDAAEETLVQDIKANQKQLQDLVDSRLQTIKEDFTSAGVATDKRLAAFREEIMQTVNTTLSTAISQITTHVNDLVQQVNEYRQFTEKKIFEYHTEMATKLGEVIQREKDITGRFRKMAEQLGQ